MRERIVVVAAVVEHQGQFLVARRLEGTHLAGYWEFPGGKVLPGETHEQALQREIVEELSTGIAGIQKIFSTSHAYAERIVDLHFYRGELTGAPQPALGQELRWISRAEFASLEFPPADAELIARLVNDQWGQWEQRGQ
jgi:8-oxo-dGTP diphosphatase